MKPPRDNYPGPSMRNGRISGIRARRSCRLLRMIITGLAAMLIFPAPGHPGSRVEKHYRDKKIFYNALSIVQNSYITETDNRGLLEGAVRGLAELAGPERLTSRSLLQEMTLTVDGDGTLVINLPSIKDNALIFTQRLSDLFDLIFRKLPEYDRRTVIHAAINGMVTSLDPHSYFIYPRDFARLRDQNRGVFEGIGLEITSRNGELVVVSPYEGTPAFEAGLRPDDRITAVNGEPARKMSFLSAAEKIRGPRGTTVTLTVRRSGRDEPLLFSVTRGVITHRSVRAEMASPGIGYIRISNFLGNTAQNVQEAMRNLQRRELKDGLVLDLRYNPGGLLNQALRIIDMFVSAGTMVRTQSRIREENVTYLARSDDDLFNGPLVVLINSGSASVSEIIAASLRDHKRAIIVGGLTFGKGSVQKVFPLRSGGAIRLTISELHTPAGERISETGIRPDFILAGAAQPAGPAGGKPIPLFADFEDDRLVVLAAAALKRYQRLLATTPLPKPEITPQDSVEDKVRKLLEEKARRYLLLKQAAHETIRLEDGTLNP